ncbi:signal transduction histidine kinase [Nocardia transvalensis]|uniref:histidine kinase n=1 Tax=Nocardia transvalensis TaxID=37333 RepID=A0A7W9PFS2_9NOCA|nr:CHASE3 domain-containing protein [Nocardia transvalensis]MBB5915186.1 signal transduction histidine kinase [Nocardia transvalensis]
MTAPKPSMVGRLSVQRWFYLVLAAMVLLVVVAAVVGAGLLRQTGDATDRLLDRLQPAVVQAYRLQAAVVDQETGARGYALTADRQFLEPFTQGQRDEAEAAARMRALIGDDPRLNAELDAVEQLTQRWRTGFAQPMIDATAANGRPTTDPGAATAGKAVFDELRTRLEQQNTALGAAVADERDRLAHTRAVRDGVLAGMVVAFLLTGVVLAVLIRRLVARPLSDLQSASLRVAGGDFDHRITAHGPADLATVAEAVEAMRRRIVAELAASRLQQDELSRQATELDEQAVELRRSNAELEQFAYVASHDLQEPLRKVASFCQLLDKRYGDKFDERGAQYLAYAVDGARRMQVLINDLLTFSRVGRLGEDAVDVELDSVVDRAVDNLSTAIEESGAVVERPERLPELHAAPTLMVMLWQNLLGNAVKFRHPDRPPVVRIECDPDAADDGTPTWRICVSDNGIGIPEEFGEKVFVIFQRLHGRDEYGGTGIGLALCKKIVEYHGGRIWLDADYTEGTRVCFTFPARNDTTEVARTATEGVSA